MVFEWFSQLRSQERDRPEGNGSSVRRRVFGRIRAAKHLAALRLIVLDDVASLPVAFFAERPGLHALASHLAKGQPETRGTGSRATILWTLHDMRNSLSQAAVADQGVLVPREVGIAAGVCTLLLGRGFTRERLEHGLQLLIARRRLAAARPAT